jgi:hypothetical protein
MSSGRGRGGGYTPRRPPPERRDDAHNDSSGDRIVGDASASSGAQDGSAAVLRQFRTSSSHAFSSSGRPFGYPNSGPSGSSNARSSRNDRSSNRNEWQEVPSRNRQPALDQGLSNLTLGGHRVTSPRDNPYSTLSTDGRPNPTENKPEKGPRKRPNISDEMHQAWLRGELDA